MIITTATLDAIRTTFGAQFKEAYEGAQTWYEKLSTEVPSTTKSNTYGWVAQMLTLREWIGPRVAQNLAEHHYVLANKSFEGTLEVDRDDIEDDNLGMYSGILLPQLGEATRKHPDKLLATLLQSTTVGFDGVSLFNDAHPNYNTTGSGATTYDNLHATTALTADNFNTVWSTMASIVGEDGRPLNVMPNLLIVPPQLKRTALEIMNATMVAKVFGTSTAAASIDNVLKGWCEVLVVPDLANEPTVWYLADVSKAIKPFVFQKRRAPEFVSRDNPSDPKVFDLKKFTYGVDYRGNVGITLPFLIAKAAA